MIGHDYLSDADAQRSLLFADRQTVPCVSEILYDIIALDYVVNRRDRGFFVIQKLGQRSQLLLVFPDSFKQQLVLVLGVQIIKSFYLCGYGIIFLLENFNSRASFSLCIF